MSNSSTINVDIVVNNKGATASVRSVGKEIEEAGGKGEKSLRQLNSASQATTNSLGALLKASVIMTSGFYAVQGAAQGVFGEFKRGLSTIEDFNLNVAASAAYITTFSKQAQDGDLAGAFRNANEYAGDLATKLEMIDSKTIASGKDLQIMSETFVQHGVLLDINNQKQVDGFTNIATALSLVTAGQNKDIQMRQEINALMLGQIRATDRLPRLLENIDPKLKEHLELWKAEGTLIQNVGGLLQGFSASTGNLNDLWATVGSTMETIHNRILRGAFKPVFADLIGLAKEFNNSMMDAEGRLTPLAQKIQLDINGAYSTGKRLVKDYGGEVATFAGILIGAKTAQIAFNAAVSANPYIIAASGIALINEGLKAYNMNIGSLPGKYTNMTSSIGNVVDVMRGLRDPETGKVLTEQEQALRKIAELRKTITSEKSFFSKDEPARIASINAEIIRLSESAKDASYAETDAMRERMRGGGEWSAHVIEMAKTNAANVEKQEALRTELDTFMENSDNVSLAKSLSKLDKEFAAKKKAAGDDKALQADLQKWHDLRQEEIVAKDEARQLRKTESARKAADAIKAKQDELENSLLAKMEKRETKESEFQKWSDGVVHETIKSQYDYKVLMLDQEVEKAKKVAGKNQELQALIAEYHRDALLKMQGYDEMYSTDNQNRIEKMQDSWMHLEEIRVDELGKDYSKQHDLEEELDTYLENSGNNRLASQLSRLKKKELADMRVAEGDIELQEKIAAVYRLKNDEIIRDAWKTEKEQLLISGKLADGFHAAMLEVQHDYITMGDVAYDTFMDIRDTFRGEVGDYLVKEFGGIEGRWGGLWDRALQSFGGFLADMVMKWAAAIAEMVAIWAANEVFEFAFGSNTGISFNGKGGSSSSGIGGTIASTAVSYAAEEYLGTSASSYVMSEFVYPAVAEVAAAITGATSATAAAAASSVSGVIASGSATPAIIDAYAATQSGVAASTAASTTAASTTAAGAGAGEAGAATVGSISAYAGPAAIAAMAAAVMYGIASSTTMMRDRLNGAGLSPTGLGQLGGIETTGRLTNMTNESSAALGSLVGELGSFSQVSIDAASGVMVLAETYTEAGDAQTGVVTGMGYIIQQFDNATGTWRKSDVQFAQLLDTMADIRPTSRDAIIATAQYVAAMAGVSSVSDELAIAFEQMQTGIYDLAGATVDATGTVAGAISMMNSGQAKFTQPLGNSNDNNYTPDGYTTEGYSPTINAPSASPSYYNNEPVGHADGGIHYGGWRIVGERGPELEYTPPSRIFSNTDTKSILSGMRDARAENQPTVIHNHFYVDGKEVATQVKKITSDQAARGFSRLAA